MKLVLILCLISLVNVSANVEFLKLSENKSGQQDAFDQNQIAVSGDHNSSNTEETSSAINIYPAFQTLYNSNQFIFPLFLYDRYPDEIIVFSTRSTLLPDHKYFNTRSSLIRSTLFGSINYKSERLQNSICWSRHTLEKYINEKVSSTTSSHKFTKEVNRKEAIEFSYAGTERFTISGNPPNRTTHINPLHASLVAGVAIVTGVALHVNQSAAWWDGKGTSFYFDDDWNDVLFADKLGHFLGGYGISYFARDALVYSGFSWDQSILLGSLLGIIVQTYVEFKDGHAQNTGFSVSDLGADVAGAAYFYLQHYVPFLQNFTPKWQYAPASMIGVPPQATTQTFLDNYNCTTAWMSVHVKNLVWGKQKSFWPKWLNIAFGYGISGYYTTDIYSRFVIGIDYNLVELLPDGPPFWNWIKQTFNIIKLPAPAIEFTKYGTTFRLLYPFTISNGSIQI